jgi:hypothetical protein
MPQLPLEHVPPRLGHVVPDETHTLFTQQPPPHSPAAQHA